VLDTRVEKNVRVNRQKIPELRLISRESRLNSCSLTVTPPAMSLLTPGRNHHYVTLLLPRLPVPDAASLGSAFVPGKKKFFAAEQRKCEIASFSVPTYAPSVPPCASPPRALGCLSGIWKLSRWRGYAFVPRTCCFDASEISCTISSDCRTTVRLASSAPAYQPAWLRFLLPWCHSSVRYGVFVSALRALISARCLSSSAEWFGHLATSSSTTANPRPASPSRAASMAAFKARMGGGGVVGLFGNVIDDGYDLQISRERSPRALCAWLACTDDRMRCHAFHVSPRNGCLSAASSARARRFGHCLGVFCFFRPCFIET